MPNDEGSSKPGGLAASRVVRVVELVSYQEGAVVSREIVKRSTGNVTIFAFDEGEGLSEHSTRSSRCWKVKPTLPFPANCILCRAAS